MDFFNLVITGAGCAGGSAATSGAGCYDWPVIHQIVIALGWVMNQIYTGLGAIGIVSLGLSIIIFVLIVRSALLPLTIRQQKFSKLQQMLQPEIRAIQKKYAGRRDNEAMAMQQEEMKNLYAKYGTSQTGGCLQSLIQLPILASLYGVLRFLPQHIPAYSQYFENIMRVVDNAGTAVTDKVAAISSNLAAVVDPTIDMTDRISNLSILPTAQWREFINCFSGTAQTTIQSNYDTIHQMNSFAGMDLTQTPWNMIMGAFNGEGIIGLVAILLPAIAGFAQWLSVQLMQNKVTKAQDAQSRRSADPMDQMQGSMRTMNFIMPLISVFFCFTIQAGVGLYWAISSAYMCIAQILINRKFRKMDMEKYKEDNMKKAAEKAKKRMEKGGEKGSVIARNAAISTKNIDTEEEKKPSFNSIAAIANMEVTTEQERQEIAKAAEEQQQTQGKKASKKKDNGPSLAERAALVQQYAEETGDKPSARKKYKKK